MTRKGPANPPKRQRGPQKPLGDQNKASNDPQGPVRRSFFKALKRARTPVKNRNRSFLSPVWWSLQTNTCMAMGPDNGRGGRLSPPPHIGFLQISSFRGHERSLQALQTTQFGRPKIPPPPTPIQGAPWVKRGLGPLPLASPPFEPSMPPRETKFPPKIWPQTCFFRSPKQKVSPFPAPRGRPCRKHPRPPFSPFFPFELVAPPPKKPRFFWGLGNLKKKNHQS